MIHDYPVLLDKDHKSCDKITHYYNHTTNECQACDSGRIKMSAQDTGGGHDSSACEATITQYEVSHAPALPVVEDMSVAQVFIECGPDNTCEAPLVCDTEKNMCLKPHAVTFSVDMSHFEHPPKETTEPVYIKKENKFMNDTFNLQRLDNTDFTACKNECNNNNRCVAFTHQGGSCDGMSRCPYDCYLKQASGKNNARGKAIEFDYRCIEHCDEIYNDGLRFNWSTYIKASVGGTCMASINGNPYVGSFQMNCNGSTIKEYDGIKCCFKNPFE